MDTGGDHDLTLHIVDAPKMGMTLVDPLSLKNNSDPSAIMLLYIQRVEIW